jgi:hypothetical protein
VIDFWRNEKKEWDLASASVETSDTDEERKPKLVSRLQAYHAAKKREEYGDRSVQAGQSVITGPITLERDGKTDVRAPDHTAAAELYESSDFGRLHPTKSRNVNSTKLVQTASGRLTDREHLTKAHRGLRRRPKSIVLPEIEPVHYDRQAGSQEGIDT